MGDKQYIKNQGSDPDNLSNSRGKKGFNKN